MKKMIASLIGISMVSAPIIAQETAEVPPNQHSDYVYVDLGIHSGMWPYYYGFSDFCLPTPMFGMGRRAQNQSNGLDVNLHVGSILVATSVTANINYLYYPHPNAQNEFYFGTGIGSSVLINHYLYSSFEGFCVNSNFIFGKQYLTKANKPRHFQCSVTWPQCFIEKQPDIINWYPQLTFSYGWGF